MKITEREEQGKISWMSLIELVDVLYEWYSHLHDFEEQGQNNGTQSLKNYFD